MLQRSVACLFSSKPSSSCMRCRQCTATGTMFIQKVVLEIPGPRILTKEVRTTQVQNCSNSFLIIRDKNKQKCFLTWCGMTLSVYHSELAILFQDVEVTVSLHRLRKKPVLTSRSTAAGLLIRGASWQGCRR